MRKLWQSAGNICVDDMVSRNNTKHMQLYCTVRYRCTRVEDGDGHQGKCDSRGLQSDRLTLKPTFTQCGILLHWPSHIKAFNHQQGPQMDQGTLGSCVDVGGKLRTRDLYFRTMNMRGREQSSVPNTDRLCTLEGCNFVQYLGQRGSRLRSWI